MQRINKVHIQLLLLYMMVAIEHVLLVEYSPFSSCYSLKKIFQISILCKTMHFLYNMQPYQTVAVNLVMCEQVNQTFVTENRHGGHTVRVCIMKHSEKRTHRLLSVGWSSVTQQTRTTRGLTAVVLQPNDDRHPSTLYKKLNSVFNAQPDL